MGAPVPSTTGRKHASMLRMSILSCTMFSVSSAARTLTQAATCGTFIEGVDIPGENLAAVGGTGNAADCLSECEALTGCNAMIRLNSNGACFLKAVDVNTVVPVDAPAFTSYLICDDDPSPNPPPSPPPSGGDNCDTPLVGFDIPGADIGSTGGTADFTACATACSNFNGCNAAIRLDSNGACFFKTVNTDTVVPIASPPFTSFLLCGDTPPGPTPPGPSPPGPPPPGDICDTFLPGQDIPGGDISSTGGTASPEACLEACQNFPGCNAAVRLDSNGGCFLKTVNPDTATAIDAAPFTSYLICDGTTPPVDPPVDPPGPPPSDNCDTPLVGFDIPGANIGSTGGTADFTACATACSNFNGCNAAIRLDSNGACFFKTVNTDTVVPVLSPPFTSFLLCGGTIPTPPGPPPPGPPPPPGNPGIAAIGDFGNVIPFPLIPVASVAFPNGQVLVWSGDSVDSFAPVNNKEGITFYAVFNSNNEQVGPLQSIDLNHDMFCPGIAIEPNGDVVVVGGSAFGDGAGATSTWTGNTFVPGPGLNTARGYNTAVTMSNGQVFTLGGSFSGIQSVDKGGEVYNGANWRATPGIEAADILSDDPQGVFRVDNYPFLFPWTGNSLFHAGPSSGMNWITNLGGNGAISPAGTRGPTAMNGNAVMYEAGKILAVGGAPSFSLGDPARTGAELITLGAVGANPNVEALAGPATARTYAMVVVLPTGEVAHIGGAAVAVEFSDITAEFTVEIWNPITKTWKTDASAATPRTYHSSAVLLPDGRVFIGGGGLCGGCSVNHLDAEIFSPNYLFNPDGSEATRPDVTVNIGSVAPGGSITVTGSEALSMVSMVRMGSSTHSINTDQRRLELCGPSSTPCTGASVSVNIPGQGIAVPGPWMVFGVNAAGVVSEAATLNVT